MSNRPPHDALLAGKTVLVTGASRGIGRAIALAAAAAGADVALTYHTDLPGATDVATAIRALGRRAHVLQGYTAQPQHVARLGTDAQAALGRIDAGIHNARA